VDRILLAAAAFCFLASFASTLYAFGARLRLPTRFNFVMVSAGFLFQTAFLWRRGGAVGRCPITNLFEVLVFLSWATVLLYLLVGPAYRLSLMGAFTSPLAFLLQGIAQGVVGDPGAVRAGTVNPWTELHAALSIVAYGAFALAAVAGTMYLVQQYQLKTRNLSTFFFELPPIRDLGLANHRLMTAGLVLLTAGLGAGLFAGHLPGALKLATACAVWALYAALLAGRRLFHLGAGRVAACSVAAFVLSLAALCGITLLSRTSLPG